YFEKGDFDRAVVDFDQAIRLEDNSTSIALYLNEKAWALFKTGKRLQEALAAVERSLRIEPKSASALDTRAHIFESLGELRAAQSDFEAALAINPKETVSADGLKRVVARLQNPPSATQAGPSAPATQEQVIAQPSSTGRRVALVIGNSRYANMPSLENPGN